MQLVAECEKIRLNHEVDIRFFLAYFELGGSFVNISVLDGFSVKSFANLTSSQNGCA